MANTGPNSVDIELHQEAASSIAGGTIMWEDPDLAKKARPYIKKVEFLPTFQTAEVAITLGNINVH